jgi:hypothetical protein
MDWTFRVSWGLFRNNMDYVDIIIYHFFTVVLCATLDDHTHMHMPMSNNCMYRIVLLKLPGSPKAFKLRKGYPTTMDEEDGLSMDKETLRAV